MISLPLAMFCEYCFIPSFSIECSKPKKFLMSKVADCSKQVQSGFSGWTKYLHFSNISTRVANDSLYATMFKQRSLRFNSFVWMKKITSTPINYNQQNTISFIHRTLYRQTFLCSNSVLRQKFCLPLHRTERLVHFIVNLLADS